MKNALIFLLFLTVSFTGFAQQDVTANTENEIVETVKVEKVESKTIEASAKIKAKVLKMNRKKSNEIISIKRIEKVFKLKLRL